MEAAQELMRVQMTHLMVCVGNTEGGGVERKTVSSLLP